MKPAHSVRFLARWIPCLWALVSTLLRVTAQDPLGSEVTGQLTVPGQQQVYALNLVEPRILYFDALRGGNQMNWSLAWNAGPELVRRPFVASDGAALSDASRLLLRLPAGGYRLTVSADGEATGTYAFRLKDLREAAPLALGVPVTQTLDPASRSQFYRFTAQAGDVVQFQALSRSNLHSLVWRLADPQARLIAGYGVQGGNFQDSGAIPLPGTGDYTLLMEGYLFDVDPGNYAFQVARLSNSPPPAVTGSPLAVGQEVAGNVAGGATNTFRLELAAASRLMLDALNPGDAAQWRVTGPFGEVTPWAYFISGDGSGGDTGLRLTGGVHRLEVSTLNNQAASYRFRLLDLAAAEPLPLNQPVTATRDPASSARIYRFTNTAGSWWAYEWVSSADFLPCQVRVRDPQGDTVWQGSAYGYSGLLSLPQSGEYTLTLEGAPSFDEAPSQLVFRWTQVEDAELGLRLGEAVTGVISQPGQAVRLRFHLTEPTRLIADVLEASGFFVARMEGPTGQVISTASLLGLELGFGFDQAPTLPAGSYTLTVQANGPQTGTFRVRLLDGGQAERVLPDAVTAVTTDEGPEARIFRLAGVAGSQWHYRFLGGNGAQLVSLLDPAGQPVAGLNSTFAGQDQAGILLPLTGDYTLILGPRASLPEARADFRFRLGRTTDRIEPVPADGWVRGQIETPGQTRRYTFRRTEPGWIYFDAVGETGAFRSRVVGPDGLVLAVNPLPASEPFNPGAIQRVTPGEYVIEVALNGPGTGAFEFRVLDLADAVPVSGTEPVVGRLDPGGSTVAYRIEVNAGDLLRLRTLGRTNLNSAAWRLVDPFGRTVSFGGLHSDLPPASAETTGGYTVWVEGSAAEAGPGTFGWVLERQSGPPPVLSGSPIQLSVPVVGALPTTETGTNRYQLTLPRPTRVYPDVQVATGSALWTWRGPPGTVLDRRRLVEAGVGSERPVLELPAGEYELTVVGTGGEYRFVLLDLDTDARTWPTTGVTEFEQVPFGAAVLLRFAAETGERIHLRGQGVPAFPTVTVLAPSGRELITSRSLSDLPLGPLAQAGNYHLLVDGFPSGGPATNRITVERRSVQDFRRTLVLNAEQAGSLPVPGQRAIYSFQLPTPGAVVIDGIRGDGAQFELADSAGRVRRSGYLSDPTTSALGGWVNLPAGDFTFTVFGISGGASDFAFRLVEVAGADGFQAGTEVAGILAPSSSARVHRFPAVGGAEYYLVGRSSPGSFSGARVAVHAPDGSRLFDGRLPFQGGRFVSPVSGELWVVVDGLWNQGVAEASYAFSVLPIPDPAMVPLLSGEELPDLVPTDLGLTSEDGSPAQAGSPMEVRWLTRNLGASAAPVGWRERVLVRRATGELLASTVVHFPGPGALAAGGSAARSVRLVLPEGPAGSGALEVEVQVDVEDRVAEANPGGSGEANNTARLAFNSQLPAYPDLTVSRLTLTPPAGWEPRSQVTAAWEVTNRGTAPAPGVGVDRFTVRNRSTGRLLWEINLPVTTPVPVGGARGETAFFELPEGADGSGEFEVRVVTDADNALFESAAAVDAEANNVRSFSSFSGPDLRVGPVSVTAQPRFEAGAELRVTGTIVNDGNASASFLPGARVTLRQAVSTEILFDQFVGGGGRLAAGAEAGFTVPIRLPAGPRAAGRLELEVRADASQQLAEFNATGTAESNNLAFRPLTIELGQYPDLIVEALRIEPNPPSAGGPLTVHWRTRNRGAAPALGAWYDRIVVRKPSNGQVLVDTTEYFDARTAALAPGADRELTRSFVLPPGTNGAGGLEVSVSADVFTQVYEFDPATEAEANNQARLNVESQLPPVAELSLELAASKLREGTVLAGRVRRTGALPAPLTVGLTSSDSRQVAVPASVTIPAGLAEVGFELGAADDTLLEPTRRYTLTAAAAGHPSVTATLDVEDDDVPVPTLSVSPNTVSEGAGANAVVGTVTLDRAPARDVTVALSSGLVTALTVPGQVVVLAGRTQASFTVGAVDDALVNAARSVALGAVVLDSVQGQPLVEAAPVLVTVTDNDGPTLSLTLARGLVAEGLDPATTGVVTRNTSGTAALVVQLVSSDPGAARVPATVTIPAGTNAAVFAIASVADGVTGGSRTVRVTASTVGFGAGQATLVVSDADLPDLVVTAVTAPEEVRAGELFPATLRVLNQGRAAAPGGFVQRVEWSTSATGIGALETAAFPGALPPGQSFSQTFQLRAPRQPGLVGVTATVDATGLVGETLEDNNLLAATAGVRVVPAYVVQVQAALEQALAGNGVPLTGSAKRADGSPAAFEPVAVQIWLRGSRRELGAVTDAAGTFRLQFQPLPGEGGHYEIAGTFPGVTEGSIQDAFDLLGMRVGAGPTVRVTEGGSVTGTVALENLSELPLTGLEVRVVTRLGDVDLTVSLPTNRLDGLARSGVNFIATAPLGSQGGAARVRVSSAEGVEAFIDFQFRSESLAPRLVVSPGRLESGMRRGGQQVVTLTVTNVGGAPSGALPIFLPAAAWLRSGSGPELPGLAPGEGAVLTLLLTPAADLPLGPYEGSIQIGSGAGSVTVPFTFRCLGDGVGALQVMTVDEYTYYAAGSPRVTNATVRLIEPEGGTEVARQSVGEQGEVRFPGLTEGTYQVEVTAPDHQTFGGSVRVEAGRTEEVLAFLPRETVRYFWTVEPTTVEDRTRITLETEFETQVPIPVVTITPTLIDVGTFTEDVTQIDLEITNHGLIAAENTRLYFGETPGWSFEPLIEQLGRLPAGATLRVPLIVRRLYEDETPGAAGRRSAGLAGDNGRKPKVAPWCKGIAGVLWDLLCGQVNNTYNSPVAVQNSSGPCQSLDGAIGFFQQHSDLGLPLSVPVDLLQPFAGLGQLLFQPGGVANGPRDFPSGRYTNTVTGPSTYVYKNPCDDCRAKLYVVALNCLADAAVKYLKLDKALAVVNECYFQPMIRALECIRDLRREGVSGDLAGRCLRDAMASVQGCQGSLGGRARGAGLAASSSSGSVYKNYVKPLKKYADCLKDLACTMLECEFARGIKSTLEEAGLYDRVCSDDEPGNPDGSRRAGRLAADGSVGGDAAALLRALRGHFDSVAPLVYLLGSSRWLDTADEDESFLDFLEAFQARIEEASAGGLRITAAERAELMALPLAAPLTADDATRFLDRWERTLDYQAAGIFDLAQVPAGQSRDFIALDELQQRMEALEQSLVQAARDRFPDPAAAVFAERDRLLTDLGDRDSGGTCARIRLKLEQEAVLTRDAFRATLEVQNESATPLEDVAVELSIRTTTGEAAEARFGIRAPELTGLSGIAGEGRLEAKTSGRVRWTLLPTSEAAPTNRESYFVSGTLSYRQGGILITVPLAPSVIDVLPSPKLVVQYFHERDVYADDPFTPEIEPSVPFRLGVLVRNDGFGLARQFRLRSAQPRIVENDRGLQIDFRILGAEVDGQGFTPSLEASFGDLAAGRVGVGLWTLSATLQGLFTDYRATFEHLDGLGDRRLSLIDRVEIHEALRVVAADRALADGKPDFLVNDVPDGADRPDTIYLSDGTQAPVQGITEAVVRAATAGSGLRVELEVTPVAGWSYVRLADPAGARFRLTGLRRSDGTQLVLETNVWTTDRTFTGLGRPPVRERLLHFVDFNSDGRYVADFALVDGELDRTAPASRVAALPTDSPARFPVTWSGEDAGGGAVAFYEVWVAEDGGSFRLWQERTEATGGIYTGQPGRRYGFYARATDAAGNREAAPAGEQAFTRVTVGNRPPVVNYGEGPVTVIEGQVLARTPVVSDPEAGQTVRFALVGEAPAGVTVEGGTGEVRWTTAEATGPADVTVRVRATDNGFPSGVTEVAVRLVVVEENQAPEVPEIADLLIPESVVFERPGEARDADLPVQPLRYALEPGAPAGMTLDPVTGRLRWRPTAAQGPSTNVVSFTVTDTPPAGVAPRSTRRTFRVLVRDASAQVALAVGDTSVLAGQGGRVPVTLNAGVALNELRFTLGADSAVLTDLGLTDLGAEVGSATLVPGAAGQAELRFQLRDSAPVVTARTLASLTFTAPERVDSRVVPLPVSGLGLVTASGLAPESLATRSGEVIVVGEDPVWSVRQAPAGSARMFGRPGRRYAVESAVALGAPVIWRPRTEVLLTEPWLTVLLGEGGAEEYFRARLLPLGPRLSLEPLAGGEFRVRLQGRVGVTYELQEQGGGLTRGPWRVLGRMTLTQPEQAGPTLPGTGPAGFIRAVEP